MLAFEDSGLARRVGLLRSLVTTSLSKCKSVDEYGDKIITTAYKLNEMKFNVSVDRHLTFSRFAFNKEVSHPKI